MRKGAPVVQRASEVPGQPKAESKPERPKAILPKYAVLKKDESLQEKSNQLAGMVALLEDEYKRIQEFVKNKVNKEVKIAGKSKFCQVAPGSCTPDLQIANNTKPGKQR